MKTAMVFAAGEGRRMLPLTEHTPKPLLTVQGVTLLEHTLRKIAATGISRVVVNAAYLGSQISDTVSQFNDPRLTCVVSLEGQPLETGGGLVHALPLLGEEHFLLVNSDVWTDYEFRSLVAKPMAEGILAHLVLVRSPKHNAAGDFFLFRDGRVGRFDSEHRSLGSYTFSGLSVVHPDLVRRYAPSTVKFPMRDLLYKAIEERRVSGEVYDGFWMDIGTPERLQALRRTLET